MTLLEFCRSWTELPRSALAISFFLKVAPCCADPGCPQVLGNTSMHRWPGAGALSLSLWGQPRTMLDDSKANGLRCLLGTRQLHPPRLSCALWRNRWCCRKVTQSGEAMQSTPLLLGLGFSFGLAPVVTFLFLICNGFRSRLTLGTLLPARLD